MHSTNLYEPQRPEDYDCLRQAILSQRFDIWKRLLLDMEQTADSAHSVVRFPNSSSYIFSTGPKTFWLMDPAFSSNGVASDGLPLIAKLIAEKFAFVVVTHLHADHCQIALAKLLKDCALQWILPKDCALQFQQETCVPQEKIIALADDCSIELAGIQITARHGYHSEPGQKSWIASAAYEITLPDHVQLFFPSDVRNYNASLPNTSPVDYTFGHVFLGREDATQDNFSLTDDFCRFMATKPPQNLILTHLYEIGRGPRDMWCFRHANMVAEKLKILAPNINVIIPNFGDTISLKRHLTI